jgi:hypothetical protein
MTTTITHHPGRAEPGDVTGGATVVAEVVADPWLATTVSVPASRSGPPGMANGGWVSGAVAAHLGSGPVEVTLHAPTPVDTPLELHARDDRASLGRGDEVLVSARRVDRPLRPPPSVPWSDALAAAARFPGHHDHPFPGCFVCGTERSVGDGLRLFPGPVDGPVGPSAALYTPHPAHARTDGRLGPADVWALLDCPTAWVGLLPGQAALLGRLTAHVCGPVRMDEPYVVVAELTRRQGRTFHGRAAVYDREERPVAMAVATWIELIAA